MYVFIYAEEHSGEAGNFTQTESLQILQSKMTIFTLAIKLLRQEKWKHSAKKITNSVRNLTTVLLSKKSSSASQIMQHTAQSRTLHCPKSMQLQQLLQQKSTSKTALAHCQRMFAQLLHMDNTVFIYLSILTLLMVYMIAQINASLSHHLGFPPCSSTTNLFLEQFWELL